jgi:hypothetical protein
MEVMALGHEGHGRPCRTVFEFFKTIIINKN